MSVKTIEIDEQKKSAPPKLKLAATPMTDVWQYVGFCLRSEDQGEDDWSSRDLNRATQIAASRLAEKVSSRSISVEVIIDPLIPLMNVTARRLVPLIEAIGENASASVEPGPGTVVIRTWWRGGFAGVDAVGIGAHLPEEIRSNLMLPGFSTRVAEWDTGFGLHDAGMAAAAINAKIEMFDPVDKTGVGFRFAISLNAGTPLDSPENQLGLPETDNKKNEDLFFDYGLSFNTVSQKVEVDCYADIGNYIEA